MSEANRGRGQPRRGYRRTKPATRSGAGRLWSRRAAGFLLHTFLSPPKEKCERPMGRPVPIRAGVGASGPAGGGVCACGRTKGLSARPLETFGSPLETIERPVGLQALLLRRSRRVIPHQRGIFYGKVVNYRCKQGAFRSPPAPLRFASRNNRAPHRATSPAPAPESARQAPPWGLLSAKASPNGAGRGLSARPQSPSDRQPKQ